jgi:hypothetical protein
MTKNPTTFSVNEPFPIPRLVPKMGGAILEMTSAGPMVIIQMPGLTRSELMAFRKSFKRYSYIEAFPVACWVFNFPSPFNSIDLNFNGRLVDPEWIDNFLDTTDGVKNALDFILIDGKIVRGIKRVGLDPEAVKLFHDTIRKQLAADYTPAEYDGALGGLFTRTTDELFKMGKVFKK